MHGSTSERFSVSPVTSTEAYANNVQQGRPPIERTLKLSLYELYQSSCDITTSFYIITNALFALCLQV